LRLLHRVAAASWGVILPGLAGCGGEAPPKPDNSPPSAVKAPSASPEIKDMKPADSKSADSKATDSKTVDSLPSLEPPAGAKDERTDAKPK